MRVHSSILTRNNSRKEPLNTFSNNTSVGVQDNSRFDLIEERLLRLKIQAIIDEFIQIRRFLKELERFGLGNPEALRQINDILIKIHSERKSNKYTKCIHTITRYLSGIRNFLATTEMKGILPYKRLFESILVAIMREIDSIEKEEVC